MATMVDNLSNFLKQWSLSLVISWLVLGTDGACLFPSHLRGDWYHKPQPWWSGHVVVTSTTWADGRERANCTQMYTHNQPMAGTLGSNHTFLLTHDENCTYCLDVLWRTPNVLQTRDGFISRKCMTGQRTVQDCDGVRRLPGVDEVTTMFRETNQRYVNCSTMLAGEYQFAYEDVYDKAHVCDSPDSKIRVCPEPHRDHYRDSLFDMEYASCNDVPTTSEKCKTYGRTYQCYGTWFAMRAGVEYKYAAISDVTGGNPFVGFRCLMTSSNQTAAQTKSSWVMSRYASCETLHGIEDGPIRLVLTKTHKTCPQPVDIFG